MKISIERSALLKALAQAQSVVERRNTIPILANVLIEAAGAEVSFRATDLDIEVLDRAPAMVEKPGATTVSAVMLHEIVRKLPDGALVSLAEDGASGRLNVTAGRSSFSLATLPKEDFPVMANAEYSSNFTAPAPVLRRLFDKAKFAISTEETRYYLNGVYMHVSTGDSGPVLRCVATDGHRLARIDAPLPDAAQGMPGVIVPRKTVGELRKLAEDTSDEIEIRLSETKVQFRIGAIILTSKLIDGTFPDYERVIPRGNDKVLTVNKKEFAEAVARVAAISNEKSRPVKLSLDRNHLRLEASSAEQGQAQEELDEGHVEYASGPLEIGFQARYLADITEQIGEKVQFKFSDGSAPTVVMDAARPEALYVLMPMRV